MLKDILSRRIPALLTRMSSEPNVSIGLVHDVLAAGPRADVVAVDGGLAAVLPDQRHDLLGRVHVAGALAVQPGTDVVDDDTGALGGEQERLLAADAPSRAGDHRHLPVEQSHGDASSCQSCAALRARPVVPGGAAGDGARRRRGASSVADGPAQGQKRASDSAVTSPISASVSPRALARPKRAVRLTTSMPGRRCGEQRPGRRRRRCTAPGAAGRCRATVAGPGQLEHAARHLALEGRRVEVALAGDDQVGALHALGQPDEAGDEVEPRLDAGPERDQPAGQAPGRAGAGHGGDVDAGLARGSAPRRRPGAGRGPRPARRVAPF